MINLANITLDTDVKDLFVLANKSPEILSWLVKNKMNLNHKLDIKTIDKTNDIYIIINNKKFGDNDFLKKYFSDLTLKKYLQLNSLLNNNVILADWLINNHIEKTSDYLNLAAYWWDCNNFIWLHKKGFEFDNKTAEKIIRIGCVDKLKYLVSCNYKFLITYQLCELAYKYNHYNMLYYLTSKEIYNKIDERFVIKSVIENNYNMFAAIYKNYRWLGTHKFYGNNTKLYNERLLLFINNFSKENTEHNKRKKQRVK
jgi:hypothetical protein